jgi:hypothetical protein
MGVATGRFVLFSPTSVWMALVDIWRFSFFMAFLSYRAG